MCGEARLGAPARTVRIDSAKGGGTVERIGMSLLKRLVAATTPALQVNMSSAN